MKRYLILIFFLLIPNAYGSIKSQIISNLVLTENLKFNFKQKINEEEEIGSCIISYPKKIFCEYDDFYKKVLVSNGKSLLINPNRNNQYFRYNLEKTALNLILDKTFIIKKIDEFGDNLITQEYHKIELNHDNWNVIIFFDKNNLNIIGWTTTDIYQNKVETRLFDIEQNIIIDDKMFDIRKYIN